MCKNYVVLVFIEMKIIKKKVGSENRLNLIGKVSFSPQSANIALQRST